MINELSKKIHDINIKNGFYEGEKNIGEMLALIHSEVSEALECDRKDKYSSRILSRERETLGEEKVTLYELLKYRVEKEKYSDAFERLVKDSFEDELADIMIRVMDLAAFKGIDLETHIDLKVRYNSLRPYKHGKKILIKINSMKDNPDSRYELWAHMNNEHRLLLTESELNEIIYLANKASENSHTIMEIFENNIGVNITTEWIDVKKQNIIDAIKEALKAHVWHGADVVPPTPLFRVIGDDGRIYRWYCNGWYVKGEHSRWDKWEVKAPNKWRYPEPKKIKQ